MTGHGPDALRRRLSVLRRLGLTCGLEEGRADERVRGVVVAHVGDGLEAVECWLLFDDRPDLRVIDVDGNEQVALDPGVLVEDFAAPEGALPDDETLRSLFGAPVQHLWIGLDE